MGGFMTTTMNIKSHIKEYFEGLSQVLFFKDAYFGAAFLFLSLFFEPELFAFGLLASVIGYLYSARYRTPKVLRSLGLLTINGFFFGIAFASLFPKSPQFYLCLLLGAMAIPLVTKAVYEVLQHWKLNPLIAPYVLSIWVIYLCADGISLHPVAAGQFQSTFQSTSLLLKFLHLSGLSSKIFSSLFHSMSQIFFLQNIDYGFCLLLLVSLFKWRSGLFFFLGTGLSTLIFYFFSGSSYAWQFGSLSFSAGLVGLALASMPEKFSPQTILLFSVLSLFLTLAADHLFRGFGLPILSLPYVVTFWLALLSRVPRLNVSWAPAEIS
jgi:urea transporter